MRPRRCPAPGPCPGCPVCRPLPRLPRSWPPGPAPRPLAPACDWPPMRAAGPCPGCPECEPHILPPGAGDAPRIAGGAASGWYYRYPVGYAVSLATRMALAAPTLAPVAPVAPRMAPAPTPAPREYPGPVLGYYRAGRFTPAAVAPECQYPGWPQGRGPGPCPGCAECDGGPV